MQPINKTITQAQWKQWLEEDEAKIKQAAEPEDAGRFGIKVMLGLRYGHSHMIEFASGRDELSNVAQRTKRLLAELANKLGGKTRQEYLSIRLYFSDLDALLQHMPAELWCRVSAVEILPAQVLAADVAPSDEIAAPLTRVTLRKTAPKWRYRVHVRNTIEVRRQLTKEMQSLIIDQVLAHGTARGVDASLRRGWNSRYFYTNSLDWLSAVALVMPGLIHRIEEFQHAAKVLENAA